MKQHDIANEVFRSVGEIAKRSDFLKAGLKDQDVNQLNALIRDGKKFWDVEPDIEWVDE